MSSGSGSARGSSRRPSPRRSIGRSTRSSGPGCSPATSAGRPSWPATTRSGRPDSASSTRSSSCWPRRPRTRPRSWPGSAPRAWVEDKYDGIRAQLHRAGDEVRLYSRDLHDVSGQFPEVIDGVDRSALGRHPRRRAPRLPRRHRAALRRPPEAARPEGAVGGDPGRGPGRLRRVRRPGDGRPGQRGRSRSSTGPLARATGRASRSLGSAPGRRRWGVRPVAPRRRSTRSTTSSVPSPTPGAGTTRG